MKKRLSSLENIRKKQLEKDTFVVNLCSKITAYINEGPHPIMLEYLSFLFDPAIEESLFFVTVTYEYQDTPKDGDVLMDAYAFLNDDVAHFYKEGRCLEANGSFILLRIVKQPILQSSGFEYWEDVVYHDVEEDTVLDWTYSNAEIEFWTNSTKLDAGTYICDYTFNGILEHGNRKLCTCQTIKHPSVPCSLGSRLRLSVLTKLQ